MQSIPFYTLSSSTFRLSPIYNFYLVTLTIDLHMFLLTIMLFAMILNNLSRNELQTSFKPITKIESAYPLFTARYYSEYLGFEIAAQNDIGTEFMLTFNGQLIFLVGSEREFERNEQTINLLFSNVLAHYYNLRSKVKIKSTFSLNKFEVIDCEGNTIIFQNE